MVAKSNVTTDGMQDISYYLRPFPVLAFPLPLSAFHFLHLQFPRIGYTTAVLSLHLNNIIVCTLLMGSAHEIAIQYVA